MVVVLEHNLTMRMPSSMYRKVGLLENFEQFLDNLFRPLFEVCLANALLMVQGWLVVWMTWEPAVWGFRQCNRLYSTHASDGILNVSLCAVAFAVMPTRALRYLSPH